MRYRKDERGFTLIELMATLVILALIIAIAVPAIGKLVTQADASADKSSISLMERAGEMAYIDGLKTDDAAERNKDLPASITEKDVYMIPTLIEKGYLKLDDASKFNQPENYVKKVNKSGKFIYMGKGKDDSSTPPGEVDTVLSCGEAETQGYTCIYTPEEFDAMRSGLAGKYILMNDIDLAEFTNWVPIGDRTAPFNGELNGNGKQVLNLTLGVNNRSNNTNALFGAVSYGKITNLRVTDVKMNDGGVSRNTAILMANIESTASNNPDVRPFEVSNVSVTGTVDGVRNFATIASNVDAHNAVSIRDVSTDIVVTNANYVSGIIMDYQTDAATGSISVTNVTIDGSLSATNSSSAAGVLSSANLEYGSMSFDQITMNAAVDSHYVSAGFIDSLYGSEAGRISVKNVAVNGSVSTDNPSANGVAAGFANSWELWGSDESVVDSVSVNGPITSDRQAVGFGVYVSYDENPGAQTLRNIRVASDIVAPDVSAFTADMDVSRHAGLVTVAGVSLSGNMTQSAQFNVFSGLTMDTSSRSSGKHPVVIEDFDVAVTVSQMERTGALNRLDRSSAFITELDVVGNYGQMSISGIALASNIQVEGELSGFVSELTYEASSSAAKSDVQITDVDLSGRLVSLTGDVYGWHSRVKHTMGTPAGPLVVEGVTATASLEANAGRAFVPTTATDLAAYQQSFTKEMVLEGTGYVAKYTYGTPDMPNSVYRDLSLNWDTTAHTGAVASHR